MAKKKPATEMPEPLPDSFTPPGYRPADPATNRPAIWSSEPEIAQLILAIAANTKAKTIIEVGCFRGATTTQLAASGLDIHVVDIAPELPPMPPNVTVYVGDSIALAPKLPKADIIFFDSVHEFKRQRDEFQRYERTCGQQNTTYIFHDAIHILDVAAFCAWLREWYDVVIINTTDNRGLAIAKWKGSRKK
jgi:hypothetical protein